MFISIGILMIRLYEDFGSTDNMAIIFNVQQVLLPITIGKKPTHCSFVNHGHFLENPNEFVNKIAFEIKINQAESATNLAAVNPWWISLRIVSGVKYSFER